MDKTDERVVVASSFGELEDFLKSRGIKLPSMKLSPENNPSEASTFEYVSLRVLLERAFSRMSRWSGESGRVLVEIKIEE